MANDTGAAAMLYARGTIWLNGAAVAHSIAIFPGDMVQTSSDALANINAPGSRVVVLPDSVLKYEGSVLSLERGSVAVATSNRLSTHIGEIRVSPGSSVQQTEFEITDKEQTVEVVARVGNLSITDASGSSAVLQGQQVEVEKKKTKKRSAAMPAKSDPIVTRNRAIVAGMIAACAIKVCRLPASPDKP